MTRLYLLISAGVIYLFYAGIFNFDTSNDDYQGLANLLPMKDIVIDTIHNYLQEQEKRLALLRKHIEAFLKEDEKAIRKVTETLSDPTKENSSNDDEEIKDEADQADASNLYKAAVAALDPECSQIGVDMLAKNGSAVDAAVATILCANVVSLDCLSLGGGLMMTVWNATTKSAYFLNAKEMASRHAKYDMFEGNASLARKAVAVPGQLLGLWTAHRRFGKLDWKELFQPSIFLCEKGFKISQYLALIARIYEKDIRAEPTLAELLINPKTNALYKTGDTIKRPVLAKTLKKLSASNGYGVEHFYNGSIAKTLTREIRAYNGIIDEEDFSNYNKQPGSGALLAFVMNVLEEVHFDQEETTLYQYIVETFKWAFARRTELGDPDFEPQVDANNEVRLVIGVAGGTKITTAVALTMALNLWKGYDLEEGMKAPRIHHQIFPMKVQIEKGCSPSIVNYLHSIGHNTTKYLGKTSEVSAIAKINGVITANAEGLRQGF